jgi:DNA helicase-2/ATP-dependent DNA helicase PcrA
VFPHSRALDDGDLEEERRLCYVGITRAERDLYITYARTRTVFGSRNYGLPSRFIAEIPVSLTDRQEQTVRRAGLGRAALGLGAGSSGGQGFRTRMTTWESSSPGSGSAAPEISYRLGDDVVHASFGDGVVTGVEPGGIVVIRFAKDRSERKLMADVAPITKR